MNTKVTKRTNLFAHSKFDIKLFAIINVTYLVTTGPFCKVDFLDAPIKPQSLWSRS